MAETNGRPKVKIPKTFQVPVQQRRAVELVLPTNEPDMHSDERHFSFSQLSTYTRCPYKYYLRYVLKVPDPKSIEAALGSGVHKVLETNAKTKIKELKDMDLTDLQDLTSDEVKSHLQDFSEPDLVKSRLKDGAVAQVTLFRVRDAEPIKPLAAEFPFKIQIGGDDDYPDEPWPVIGYIDTIEKSPRTVQVPGPTPEMLKVMDYKVVKTKRSQNEINTTPQTVLYDMVITETLGAMPDAYGLRQFGVNRDGPWTEEGFPTPDLLDPTVRLIRQERVKQVIRRVQDAIKKDVFYPTDDSKNCSWCPYRQICQFSQVKTSDRNG